VPGSGSTPDLSISPSLKEEEGNFYKYIVKRNKDRVLVEGI
jgi:hypothetical protein